MIKNRHTDFTIKKPEEVSEMESHMLDDIRKMLSDAIFFVPTEITNNQRKLVYKVGFLKTLYSLLYPDLSNSKIYTMIDKRWQIFKSRRQMERLCYEYINLKKQGEI